MFDFGFQELLLIFIIALVVLGPTRMPGLVSKVGKWVGKARSMARQFREQLESEVQLDELNKMTERTTKAAAKTPAVPSELSGEPLPENSGYPYGVSAAAPATGPQPGDDDYSHAHALGDAPMPDTPEPAAFEPAVPGVVLDNEPLPMSDPAPVTEPAKVASIHE
jgi:sec-independent protein translocase protein TatB